MNGLDHFLDLEHDRHFDQEEPCTGCCDEDCECSEIEPDFNEPEVDEEACWAGIG